MIYKFLVIVLLINSKAFGHSSPADHTLPTSAQPVVAGGQTDIPSDKANDPNSGASTPSGHDSDTNSKVNEDINRTVRVSSVDDLPVVPPPSLPNDMLSFEEWRKKISEKAVNLEQPSQKTPQQTSSQSQQSAPATSHSSAASKQKPIAKRARNFASYECGAKVVDANSESESVQR